MIQFLQEKKSTLDVSGCKKIWGNSTFKKSNFLVGFLTTLYNEKAHWAHIFFRLRLYIRVSQIFRFRCLADRWCISWNVAHMPNFRPFGSSPVQHNGFKVYYINLLHKSDFGDKSANLTPKTCMWKAHNFADFRRIMQLSKDTKNSKIHPVWGPVGVFKMPAFFAKKGIFFLYDAGFTNFLLLLKKSNILKFANPH